MARAKSNEMTIKSLEEADAAFLKRIGAKALTERIRRGANAGTPERTLSGPFPIRVYVKEKRAERAWKL
jgi:hypothetical protein